MKANAFIGIVRIQCVVGNGEWFYQSALGPLRITAGVKALTEKSGRTRLLDWVASDLVPLSFRHPWLRIEWRCLGGQSRLSVCDGDGRSIIETSMTLSEPTQGNWVFYWTDWILMLSNEH